MSNLSKTYYNEIYTGVANELGLPVETVKGAYEGYWLFAKDYITKLDLKNPDLTEEEFLRMRTGINFPSLGKLAYPLHKFRAIKARNTYIKHLNKNDSKSH